RDRCPVGARAPAGRLPPPGVMARARRNLNPCSGQAPRAWAMCGLGLLLLLSSGARAQPLVVLDPGHGGAQDGAKGVKQKEKELTLQVSQRVQRALQGKARVVLTRDRDADLTLSQRVER